ncbi:MAG: catabolite control protein A, partial [Clostridiaceae bacterium]|nr:catabolite control protein A [Clostridiaceae bacterium]
YDMGSVAMRMLIKILNKKEIEETHYTLDYELIKRDSSK